MINEDQTAVEGADETPSVKSNLSSDDFVAQRTQELLGGEPTQETAEEQEQEVSEEPTEETPEVVSKEPDVLSQIDLDSLSPEEFNQLKEKLQSRAVDRYGELTAKRKEAEERAQALEQKIAELNQSNPLEKPQEVKDNPFRDINTVESLQEKYSEANMTISWAEELLDDAGMLSADDVVTTVEGKEYTKSEVRHLLKESRKARDVYLPNQLNSIQQAVQAEQIKTTLQEKAASQLSWFGDEESEVRKKYEAEINGPAYQKLMEIAPPDVAAYLPYVVAHAANSLYGKVEAPKVTPADVEVSPPKSTPPAAAAPTNNRNAQSKAIGELTERFKKSGDTNDFIKLRTAQLS